MSEPPAAVGRTAHGRTGEMGHLADADHRPRAHDQRIASTKETAMKRLTRRLLTSGFLAAVVVVLTSGAADARIAVNHNEN